MIAQYKDNYFCVDLTTEPIEIWRYDAVPGFKECVDDQLVYYNKFINRTEIDRLFDVGFSVCWDGKWCGIFYSEETDLLSLKTDDPDFALAHGMTLLEREVYSCARSASEFAEYRMYTQDINSKEKTYTMIPYEEFKRLWKLFRTDLIPPRG